MTGTPNRAPRGLEGVVAAQTRLSHVDGLAGELIIGGYALDEIAGRVTFEEAAHLLWKGALPNREQLRELSSQMARLRELSEKTLEVVRAAAKAPPIDVLRMACATLSLDVSNPEEISLEADLAHARIAAGADPIAPREDLSLAANFLYM